MPSRYNQSVFINCPFDKQYKPMFEALVFAVHDAGFVARCALETSDSAQVRLDKILQIVSECRYGLHDISRTQSDPKTGLPRFNMPFELGVFLGSKRFGGRLQKQKGCLILDISPYRYQSFISDIAGQDIAFHKGQPKLAIHNVRAWLRTASGRDSIPGGARIWHRFCKFRRALPGICRNLQIRPTELTFADLSHIIVKWLKAQALTG